MTDLALEWIGQAADLVVDLNDLQTDDGLRGAVIESLLTDRDANVGDEIPDGGTRFRGWCLNVDGDQWGSRLWLLDRGKQTPDELARAEEYSREALAWMVEDKVAESVDVLADFLETGAPGLALLVTITKPGGEIVRWKFGVSWAAEMDRGG